MSKPKIIKFADQSAHGGGVGPAHNRGPKRPTLASMARSKELAGIAAGVARKKQAKKYAESKQGTYMKKEPGFKAPKRGAAATLASVQKFDTKKFISGIAVVASRIKRK